MGEGRHSDRHVRVAPYLDPALHERLRKLAFVCGTTKSTMARIILEECLFDPDLLNRFQEKYGKGLYRLVVLISESKSILHLY